MLVEAIVAGNTTVNRSSLVSFLRSMEDGAGNDYSYSILIMQQLMSDNLTNICLAFQHLCVVD